MKLKILILILNDCLKWEASERVAGRKRNKLCNLLKISEIKKLALARFRIRFRLSLLILNESIVLKSQSAVFFQASENNMTKFVNICKINQRMKLDVVQRILHPVKWTKYPMKARILLCLEEINLKVNLSAKML